MNKVRTPLILVADDDAEDRMLVKEAFEETGVAGNILFVKDGEELLDYLLHKGSYSEAEQFPAPHLILLDLNMPRKDGKEALKEIKADVQLRGIPVVVLTTSMEEQEVRAIYALGASSFVAKPSSFSALVEIMKCLSTYWFKIVVLPEIKTCKVLLNG